MADPSADVMPAMGPRPRSRGWERVRLFLGWVCQWYLWDQRPHPDQYRSACEDRDRYAARVRKLEVELAEAVASSASARAEVVALAGVIERDRERVHAEAAKPLLNATERSQ